jgi:hypothetical protein
MRHVRNWLLVPENYAFLRDVELRDAAWQDRKPEDYVAHVFGRKAVLTTTRDGEVMLTCARGKFACCFFPFIISQKFSLGFAYLSTTREVSTIPSPLSSQYPLASATWCHSRCRSSHAQQEKRLRYMQKERQVRISYIECFA